MEETNHQLESLPQHLLFSLSNARPDQSTDLTQTQLERMERNRLRALSLRRARVSDDISNKKRTKQLLHEDTLGGFLLEEEEEEEEPLRKKKVIHDEGPRLGDELLECDECHRPFPESYLWNKFKCSTCDGCRDPDGKHALITKTEAKERFLLRDWDFEERGGPPLLYLVKKNPHSSRGDMKLYMLSQLMSRSYGLWGGKDELEQEIKKREETKEKRKQNKFSRQVKELRKTVYSSSLKQVHTHLFSLEVYDSASDTWTKTCQECDHSITFEKL